MPDARCTKRVRVQIEYAKISLQGGRKDNQDRIGIAAGDRTALLMVFDGMGGHSDGALAAQTALDAVQSTFASVSQPVLDPQGFLYRAIGAAHDAVVALGSELAVDHRPRATCALCLIQDRASYWAHVGDSRIYLIRDNRIHTVSRDHSHVEVLIHEGVIKRAEATDHPMRNFVESCLGGDDALPGITVTRKRPLRQGDSLMLCSVGVWSGIEAGDIATLLGEPEREFGESLRLLAERAVRANGTRSDNASAAALRWRA